MSGLGFTPEEDALREEVRRFAERELAPAAAALDAAAAFHGNTSRSSHLLASLASTFRRSMAAWASRR
jgi:alkylation response protein AidB-like acyl-CoA dehydrogenase